MLVMSVRKTLQSLWRNDEGSALIEGAIVVPLLLILVLGVFELSWLIDQQHLISTGIHDAARYIAQSVNPNDLTIQRRAKNLATTGAIDGDTARVRGWTARDVNITYSSVGNPLDVDGSTTFRGGAVIQRVTVSTTFTVPSLGFFGFLGLKPPALTVSHQERVIGPGQISR
jgi:Flp pilus assembly protein TadG